MNLLMKQKQNQGREQTGDCKRGGFGEGWSGRLGLADTRFYI